MRLPEWYTFPVECSVCGFKFIKPVEELTHEGGFICPHCGRDIREAIEKWRDKATERFTEYVKTFMRLESVLFLEK